jgi:capsular polysaccharide biosynthesis protein
VLLIGLVAVAASAVALSRREASYTATATLLITPLAQNDEAFLGTSLLRDSADAIRTAATAAEAVHSRQVDIEAAQELGGGWTAESVRGAVDVTPAANVNVLLVTARAAKPDLSERLATSFARSTLRVRWRTIVRELDGRIAALTARRPDGAADGGELARELQILRAARQTGTDPTLRLQDTSPAIAARQLPGPVVVVLALLGGLLLGALAAVGFGRLGRRVQSEDDVLAAYPLPVLARMPPTPRLPAEPGPILPQLMPPAAREALRRLAVLIERWAPEGGTVAVGSPSDGDGPPTAAASIAAAISEGGRTATVVELDRSPPRLDGSAESEPGAATIKTVLEGATGPPPVHELLAKAQARADFVVVAVPPLSGDARALRTATLADMVVLVVRLGHTARQELRHVRNLLEHIGVRPAGLLLVEANEGRSEDEAPPAGRVQAQPRTPTDVLPLRH